MTICDEDRRPTGPGVLSERGFKACGQLAQNERHILTLLHERGPMPQAEIARTVGLSAQTVSTIMRRLERARLLERGEVVRGKVGHPSVPMRLAADGAFFFGLKVGRRSVDLLLVDFVGQIRGRTQQQVEFPTPDTIMRFALSSIAKLRAELSVEQAAHIAGLGIAIPFHLWDWAISIGAPSEEMRQWETRDIRQELSEKLEVPVYLQNDASAACRAELIYGTERRPRDFLYFFIGYFVGGGLVLNGTLFTGRTGNAAALGSLPIPALGGAHLQLVDVASLSVLGGMLQERGEQSAALWNTPRAWDFHGEVVDGWIRDASAGIAYAIAASACVVDCEAVLIDGWIPEDIRARLVARTAAALRELDVNGIEKPEVRAGTIGPDGRALGAAAHPFAARYLVDLEATGDAG